MNDPATHQPVDRPAADGPPADVLALAEERAAARLARDFPTADALKARIEAAGWKVVDDGLDFELAPLRPPDVEVDGRRLVGHPDSVPSVLDEPATAVATIVLVARRLDEAIVATLTAVGSAAPAGTQRVVVAPGGAVTDDPSPGELEAAVAGASEDVVQTAGTFAPGAALQAGARRAKGPVVVWLLADRRPTGDLVTPLGEALADPAVAVAGADGRRSSDLRRFEPAAAGPVTALGAGCLAFRRADLVTHGPLDDRLRLDEGLAIWWSLALRDAGPGQTPRTALAIELPLAHVPDPAAIADDHDRERAGRRDRYRIADRFEGRADLR